MHLSKSLVPLAALGTAAMVAASAGTPSIKKLGRWPGYSRGGGGPIRVVNDRAYMSVGSGGVLVVNVSDPTAPIPLSSVDVPAPEYGYAGGLDVGGGLVYVAFGGAGLGIADVSDPNRPTMVGAFKALQVGNATSARSVRVLNQLAYVAYGDVGLVILDIRSPESPVLVGSYSAHGAPFNDVDVIDGIAYVASDAGLVVLDVSNPALPQPLGGFNTPPNAPRSGAGCAGQSLSLC